AGGRAGGRLRPAARPRPVTPLARACGMRIVLAAEQVDAHAAGETRDGGERAEARALEAARAQRVQRDARGERGDGPGDGDVHGSTTEEPAANRAGHELAPPGRPRG